MTKEEGKSHITKETLLGQIDTLETNFEEGYKRVVEQIEFFRELVQGMYVKNSELFHKAKSCEDKVTQLKAKLKDYEKTGR